MCVLETAMIWDITPLQAKCNPTAWARTGPHPVTQVAILITQNMKRRTDPASFFKAG